MQVEGPIQVRIRSSQDGRLLVTIPYDKELISTFQEGCVEENTNTEAGVRLRGWQRMSKKSKQVSTQKDFDELLKLIQAKLHELLADHPWPGEEEGDNGK